MKRNLCSVALLFSIASSLLVSCKKSDSDSPVPPPTKVPDVYLVGNERDMSNFVAVYWKNGQRTALSGETGTVEANSVSVDGSDVYVAGTQMDPDGKFYVKYWKNGVEQELGNGETRLSGEGTAIKVSGTDVYLGFNYWDGTTHTPKIWKNGVVSDLQKDPRGSKINALAISGSDVFTGGFDVLEPGNERAKIWKHNEGTQLDNGPSAVLDVFRHGNDLYACGYDYITPGGKTRGVYWKNGIKTILGAADRSSYANGIFVSENGIYIAFDDHVNGKSVAKLWHNGNWTTVSGQPKNDWTATAVAVKGEHVYIVMNEFGQNVPFTTHLWHSGSRTQISNGTKWTWTYAIALH